MRRVRAAIVLALMCVASALGGPSTALAAGSQGLCAGNQWNPALTGQYYYIRTATGAAYIDVVHGWMTARKLFPCEGLGITQGWSFAAAANLQGGGDIYQLGMFAEAGDAGTRPYFVYTADNGSGLVQVISDPRPLLGNRYHFEIVPTSGGNVKYRIWDVAGNLLWARNTFDPWDSDLKQAWWGWEIGNMGSAGGGCGGCNDADLVGLWSDNFTGPNPQTQVFINPHSSEPDGDCNDGTHMHVSGSLNEIFNVETHSRVQQFDGGAGCG